MAKAKKDKTANYLDFIPVRSEKHKWDADDKGVVTIYVENKGFFNKLAQHLLKKPKVSQVHLEQFGSFIFPLIDGKSSIYEIGQKVKEHFGEDAEPLYPRLTQYFKMMHDYGFINYAD